MIAALAIQIESLCSDIKRLTSAIDGGASKGLEKSPDNVTKFVGNDFKVTYRKVVE